MATWLVLADVLGVTYVTSGLEHFTADGRPSSPIQFLPGDRGYAPRCKFHQPGYLSDGVKQTHVTRVSVGSKIHVAFSHGYLELFVTALQPALY